MILMPSNHSGILTLELSKKYPDRVGWLLSPAGFRNIPDGIVYALDNGCFTGFNREKFINTLDKTVQQSHKPLFVVCPDVIFDSAATKRNYKEWYPIIKDYGFNVAFVVQDGCRPCEVPESAYCCFIGGSTRFKLHEGEKFKGVSEWFHVGRVNTAHRLLWAHNIGADSCDGTGFFRGQYNQLYAFMQYVICGEIRCLENQMTIFQEER